MLVGFPPSFSKAIKRVHSTSLSPDNQFSRLRSAFVYLVETAISVVDKSELFPLLLKIKHSYNRGFGH